MKKAFFALLLLSAILLPAPNAAAQTAAELERVLALPVVSYGDAAWVVLGAAGTALPAAAEDSPDGAYRFAADNNWLPQKAAPETPATLGGLSLLIMKALNINGGLMYTLFPGPRSGYRELTYRKIIQGRAYSSMIVSGPRLLRILSRALEYSGDTAALPAASPVEPAAASAEAGQETPADEAAAPAAETAAVAEPETPPPAIPAAEPHAREERERIAEIIHTELEEKRISDTDVRATGEGITISLNNIRFLPDSTELVEAEKQKLQNIAAILNRFPNRRILVGGHTAMAGFAEGRMQVSTGRARAVAEYLVALGCRAWDEIIVRGYGADRPLGDPSTPAGQALNRRVEITLLDEGSGGNE
jgi:outer membrane protein OmpA-like peptidoglycan-associated protein